MSLMSVEFQTGKMKVMEIDSGDACTNVNYLMPLKYTFLRGRQVKSKNVV